MSYDTVVGQTFYGMMSTYDDETLTSVYTIIATDTAANTQQKAAELETQGYYTSPGRLGRTAWNCTLTIGWMRPASP